MQFSIDDQLRLILIMYIPHVRTHIAHWFGSSSNQIEAPDSVVDVMYDLFISHDVIVYLPALWPQDDTSLRAATVVHGAPIADADDRAGTFLCCLSNIAGK